MSAVRIITTRSGDRRRCACPECACNYPLDGYAPGEHLCGACLDNCRVLTMPPRWQQVKAAYPLWEAVGDIGLARLWRNEGASPGWGWQVLTDAGALVAGGMCERRDDAEAAAFSAVGVCDD